MTVSHRWVLELNTLEEQSVLLTAIAPDSYFSFWSRSLAEPGAHQLARPASQRALKVSLLQHWGGRCHWGLGCDHRVWDVTTGLGSDHRGWDLTTGVGIWPQRGWDLTIGLGCDHTGVEMWPHRGWNVTIWAGMWPQSLRLVHRHFTDWAFSSAPLWWILNALRSLIFDKFHTSQYIPQWETSN